MPDCTDRTTMQTFRYQLNSSLNALTTKTILTLDVFN